ncbi:hypothetical protein DAPPUDRAFT_95662 [Daphnia pulex]|uniref:Uncharacterized protein n=1 Tax=Daphnia pulex TaxID=6669 RepID=E9FUD5_DAPPU|nr:hypothetical protein DAPPUDRAFT_95662 [Daphnia pulex]|eukprot:EFX88706.1 hypothetical protein DAPPUDRAFT_95662 [Daphnia pulex]
MTTATDKSVELIDVSDDDCSSVVSQTSSDIIFIEEVEFHNDQENNEISSKRKRRTKTIDVYFTSASGESNKLVTLLSLDTAPITGGVVTSENNGDLESNKISVSSGPSLLPPEGIAVSIKEIAAIVNKPSDTHEGNANDGVLRNENEETIKKSDSHKKMVNEEESECRYCSNCTPPFHTCKKFSNGLVNSKSTNISKPRNISLTKNGFECDVCLKKTPYLYVLKVHLRQHVTVRRSERIERPKRALPFWDCTYCNKKFQLATRCEQHELRCEKETNDSRLLTTVKGMSLRKLR